MLGMAGSVFCLGCDKDGGVTGAGAGFLFASGGGCCCWVWAGSWTLVAAAGLVSFGMEEVDEACLRC